MFDTNKNLNHNSWTKGGTLITNFDISKVKKYSQSIDEYEKLHPNSGLVISGFAYTSNETPIFLYSLHQVGTNSELSEFWNIFNSK